MSNLANLSGRLLSALRQEGSGDVPALLVEDVKSMARVSRVHRVDADADTGEEGAEVGRQSVGGAPRADDDDVWAGEEDLCEGEGWRHEVCRRRRVPESRHVGEEEDLGERVLLVRRQGVCWRAREGATYRAAEAQAVDGKAVRADGCGGC